MALGTRLSSIAHQPGRKSKCEMVWIDHRETVRISVAASSLAATINSNNNNINNNDNDDDDDNSNCNNKLELELSVWYLFAANSFVLFVK